MKRAAQLSSPLIKRLMTLLIIGLLSPIVACTIANPPLEGIQTGFEALNPGGIIAVPVFVLPNPSNPEATIDRSILASEKMILATEKKVISSFSNQPNINGYSFDIVKETLKKSNNEVVSELFLSMKKVATQFSSRDPRVRIKISPACLARRNFEEFYSHCLAKDPKWISDLNNLSARILNADSAMFVVLTELDSGIKTEKYFIHAAFSVLLVDTNNGKLIWGRSTRATMDNPPEKKYFPEWKELLDKLFPEEFWKDFPGRISRKDVIETSITKLLLK